LTLGAFLSFKETQWKQMIRGLSSYTTSKYFFCTSKFFLNFQKVLRPFKKPTDITLPKLLLDIDFQKSNYMISGSQNISPKVNFQKSKYITRSRLPKVNFRKSKYITGSQLPEIKITGSQKILPEVDFRKSKIEFYFKYF